MSKKSKILLSIILVIVSVFVFHFKDIYAEECSSGHKWPNSGTVTKAPTCTAKGTMTYTCTVSGCGATKTEDIAATGHNSSGWDKTADATCTSNEKGCTYCNKHGDDKTQNRSKETEKANTAKGHKHGTIQKDADGHWYNCTRTGCTAMLNSSDEVISSKMSHTGDWVDQRSCSFKNM